MPEAGCCGRGSSDPIQPPFSRWDIEGARFLNIQILNSVAFSTVTALPAPPTPVTPQVYAGYGLPYRKDYDDVDMDGTETSSELDGSTITGDSNATNSDATTLGPSPNKSNPILSIQSVSRRDRLLLAAKRILKGRRPQVGFVVHGIRVGSRW